MLSTWHEDGRFRLTPSGAIYPCHTINAARVLCLLGHASDDRLRGTFDHLLGTLHDDGGWRCQKFSFGRGQETESSNPGPTLAALDALRLAGLTGSAPAGAVELLLEHWVSRAPLGPCHYGIGTLFLQVGYPFAGYNLFHYVYVLSFYDQARDDPRFREALARLESQLVDGQIVVQRVHRRLADLAFCRKGEPSNWARRVTRRFGPTWPTVEQRPPRPPDAGILKVSNSTSMTTKSQGISVWTKRRPFGANWAALGLRPMVA